MLVDDTECEHEGSSFYCFGVVASTFFETFA